MRPLLSLMIAALAGSSVAPVRADIYKHVDEQGRVTYSNLPAGGATRVDLGPLAPAPKQEAKAPKVNERPANFPKVDTVTQKKRDDTRRRLLTEELGAEQKSLLDAQSALDLGSRLRQGEKTTSASYLDRVNALRQTVSRHQKNIEAINRELALIR